jgi:hypothetical protein
MFLGGGTGPVLGGGGCMFLGGGARPVRGGGGGTRGGCGPVLGNGGGCMFLGGGGVLGGVGRAGGTPPLS